MCGIVGYTGAELPGLIAAMASRVSHRGPDAAGRFSGDGIHFGVRRLAIVDRTAGAQPCSDESGRRVVALNGEIYNHRPLREELRALGHTFVAGSDTEVLAHLHEEEGAAMLARLDGMFALALWDSGERSLLLASDRMGEKPLYHARLGDRLFFASEIKALLAVPGLEARLDPIALEEYLAHQWVSGARTLFSGIAKLEPGHRLLWKDGAPAVERWWAPPAHETGTLSPAELAAALDASVKARLPDEVRAGCFLSGGLDSSVIAAVMAKHARLSTYSVGFEGQEAADERPAARAVAEALGADHHEIVMAPPDGRRVAEVAWHLDVPPANAAALATHELARQARADITVVLTGEGADEIFGGYGKYVYPAIAERVPERWSGVAGRLLKSFPRRGRLGRLAKLGDLLALPAVARYGALNCVFDADDRRQLLGSARPDDELLATASGRADGRLLDRLSRVDLLGYLPEDNLMKVDRVTMAHGMEARAPYLDHALVERVLAVPMRVRIGGRGGKPLLRAAAAGLLPERLLARPKRAFDVPLGSWMAGPLSGAVRRLLDPARIARQRLFDAGAVARAVRAGTSAGADAAQVRRLWTLFAFQVWHLVFLEPEQDRERLLWRAG
jgi:asparagine synthase (glutamine-hydrolysing)